MSEETIPLGIIKFKGGVYTLAPHRFNQIPMKTYIPWVLLKKKILGYCVVNRVYWLLIQEIDNSYSKIPFARNELWFKAMTSEPEFVAIANLNQIYITGVG